MNLGQWLVRAYAGARRSGVTRLPGFSIAFRQAYFAYKRWIEDPYGALLQRRPDLLGDGHVLDVGANIGYTAQLFAGRLAPGRCVYAFEPESSNFAQLQKTIRAYRLAQRVVAVRAAVGAAAGEIDLWVNPDHHGDHRVLTESLRRSLPEGACEHVPLVSLDGFAEQAGISESISFVKIDVQGYEQNVCEGMEHLLTVNPQLRIALEYSPAQMSALGGSGDALIGFFRQRGFAAQVIGQDGALGEPGLEPAAGPLAARGYIDLLFSRTPLC